ncbi:MAG TPA: fumarylacetoacetate hydrolase family protein, partial [Vicinamibacterales bacterium]
MKLATVSIRGGSPEIVAVGDNGRIVRLGAAHPKVPSTMIELIGAWDVLRDEVRQAVAQSTEVVDLDGNVRFLAPIARPGKIMAMGLNYADHVAEAGIEVPKHQVWFCKQPNTVHPPYEPIQIPKASAAIDYEVELVFVIGKRGRHIPKGEAP